MSDASPPRRLFGPDLRLLVPHDWLARAAVELLHPELKAHVLVTFDDIGEQGTLDEYVDSYGSVHESRTPNYEEVRRSQVELGGSRLAVLRQFRWQADGGRPVEQLQAYVVDGQSGIAATLSTPRPLAEVEPLFLELLGGIVSAGAPGVGLVRLVDEPRSRTFDALERGQLAAARGGSNGPAPDSGRWRDARTAWEARTEGAMTP